MRMRTLLLGLLLLPALTAAQDFGARFPAGSVKAREQASQALEAVETEYARLKAEFDARDAQCYREILVNDCREKVRRDRELARRDVHRVELEAKDTRRRLDHEELLQKRAEQEKKQAAEAEARRVKEEKSRSEAQQRQQKATDASQGSLTAEEIENAAEYQKKQEEAAKRAEVSAAERKRREQRRAERKKELERKEADREAIRKRAEEAAASLPR